MTAPICFGIGGCRSGKSTLLVNPTKSITDSHQEGYKSGKNSALALLHGLRGSITPKPSCNVITLQKEGKFIAVECFAALKGNEKAPFPVQYAREKGLKTVSHRTTNGGGHCLVVIECDSLLESQYTAQAALKKAEAETAAMKASLKKLACLALMRELEDTTRINTAGVNPYYRFPALLGETGCTDRWISECQKVDPKFVWIRK